MKITHGLIYFSKNFRGGLQEYVKNITAIQKQTNEVSILTTSAFAPKEPERSIQRVRSWGIFARTPVAPSFPRALREITSGIVHLHGPNPLIDFSARNATRPIVVTLHNIFPEKTLSSRILRFQGKKFLLSHLHKAQAITVYRKNILEKLIDQKKERKILEGKTYEIPPGIDHEMFYDTKEERGDDILFAAHIRPEKGLHLLIDALRFVKNKNSKLWIYGTVHYFQNYARKQLKRALDTYGDRIRIVMNPTKEQLTRAYHTCGCIVAPSIGLESWNFVLLEAAACGAAIVRSPLPAFDWLSEEAGKTADPSHPQELAAAIDGALIHKKTLGKKAHEISRKYSWENTAEKLSQVYLSVMTSKKNS